MCVCTMISDGLSSTAIASRVAFSSVSTESSSPTSITCQPYAS